MKSKIRVSDPTARAEKHERVPRSEEWGRKAILSGFLIATIGMVVFCYVTLGDGLDADMYNSLFQNGVLGWAALLFLIMGVGVWFAGNIVLLKEGDRADRSRRPEAP
jgi:hypothetical protein